MDKILEAIMFIAACAVPVSIFGMSAWLAYKRVPGWGWFLVGAIIVLASTRIHFDGF